MLQLPCPLTRTVAPSCWSCARDSRVPLPSVGLSHGAGRHQLGYGCFLAALPKTKVFLFKAESLIKTKSNKASTCNGTRRTE